jgi:hypothetical protein
MMAMRCHVIVTARAKEKYEVSKDGEPVAKGTVPDVERNLAYAVDLIVELGVEELPKGKQPSPDDYTALVVGSRSPAIQIGTLFHDPSLGLFLPATAEGEAPEDVVSTVDVQVHNALVAPSTWRELKAILEGKNWDIDRAKELLRKKFGPFNPAKVVEYWEYLMAYQEQDEGPEGR